MNINDLTYKDRSEFLRGYSVIVRKSNCKNADEKTMFSVIGKSLGFEKEYCEKSLEYIKVNKYISEEPAVFADKLVAEFFLREVNGILLQCDTMSDEIIEWLEKTAKLNEVNFKI